ncbi:hypothetical protein EDB85DRAFT_2045876 [Lactarius pseudohatsudake]|nr:hypothetical protein EDB85DRAFT_2045876 [Lactarius pseudohatsudake]
MITFLFSAVLVLSFVYKFKVCRIRIYILYISSDQNRLIFFVRVACTTYFKPYAVKLSAWRRGPSRPLSCGMKLTAQASDQGLCRPHGKKK